MIGQELGGELARYEDDETKSIFELIDFMEVRQGITFAECLHETIKITDFVKQFDRFSGLPLYGQIKLPPITQMIDKRTGYLDHIIRQYIWFVKDLVWDRFPIKNQ